MECEFTVSQKHPKRPGLVPYYAVTWMRRDKPGKVTGNCYPSIEEASEVAGRKAAEGRLVRTEVHYLGRPCL